MSQDEIREQKALLLLEHTEAESSLKHLQEKALRIGRAFQSFGHEMEHSPETVLDASQHGTQGVVGLKSKTAEEIRLLKLDEAFSLADQIRAAKRKLDDLEHRMRQVGL